MMYYQVLISGLILLLPAAVGSFPEVHAVVGHPVTLPCSYPVSNGISSMSWGRGACASDTSGQTFIWTDGYKIYYRTNNHYQLKGQLLQGNASLTIESVAESDSGLYCCLVEMKGSDSVRRLTFSLQVQPAWTDTATSSHHPWSDHTAVAPTKHALKILTKGFYIGISVFAALLILAIIPTIMYCRHLRKKKRPENNSLCSSVVFQVHQNEAYESTVCPQAKDIVYVTEDSFHSRIKSRSEMKSFQSCGRK
ncbi:hepatitis A virus cellular receptor 1 homolog [Acomys russatus]|uniref:hepatitis A virus cellular receptor 1 homolog n=1 Tax=Acomys russatus TaxID=60746 RepID=UPI0021E347D9|nr:hepatitis A virus cellular receptor 1 homolog [Acomys russatus]